jgi:hypothetical protein
LDTTATSTDDALEHRYVTLSFLQNPKYPSFFACSWSRSWLNGIRLVVRSFLVRNLFGHVRCFRRVLSYQQHLSISSPRSRFQAWLGGIKRFGITLENFDGEKHRLRKVYNRIDQTEQREGMKKFYAPHERRQILNDGVFDPQLVFILCSISVGILR